MRYITIYNHKGGVGKTATAVNLAYNLTLKGYSVLLMDADPQGNASRQLRRYDMLRPSMIDFLRGETGTIRRTLYPGLDIIPSNLNLNSLDDTLENEKIPISLDVADAVQKNMRQGTAAKYNYCVIDCPPGMGLLTRAALRLADSIIIPLSPDGFSADGLGTCLYLINSYAPDPDVHGLITRYYRCRDTLAVIHSMTGTQDVSFFDTVIRRCSAVDHSVAVRKPLMKCASRSPASLDYMDLAEEFLRKERS